MRGNSRLFWALTAALLGGSSLFKGWQVDRNVLAQVNDIALTRAALDPMLMAEQRPRLLIAGGSNALSGYDSSRLSEATGMPTFNIGLLSEGYDYRNAFEVIESRARSRDIVMLSTIRFASPQQASASTSTYVIGNDRWLVPRQGQALPLSSDTSAPPMAPLFAEQTLLRLLMNWSEQLQIGVLSETVPVAAASMQTAAPMAGLHKSFARFSFDARGDWVNCTKAENPKPMSFDPATLEQSAEYLAALDQFAARLQARGITLRVTPATMLVQPEAVAAWSAQHLALARAARQVVFLPFDDSRQLLTDSNRFCDTNAHLLRSEIAANNQAIVEAVKNLSNDQAIVEPAKTVRRDKVV